MKIFTFIISILLISFIISEECDKEDVSSKKDCKDLTLSGDEKYCCFINQKATLNGNTREFKGCEGFSKEEYDNVEKLIEQGKKSMKDEGATGIKYSIDCKSSYLQYYLAFLLLLIIL